MPALNSKEGIVMMIVSAIIIGIVGFAFGPGFINSFKDNGTSSFVSSVNSQEKLYSSTHDGYADEATLTSAANGAPLVEVPKGYTMSVAATDTAFCAAVKSDSGRTFWTHGNSNKSFDSQPSAAAAGIACPAAA
jgi:competence protein ComGC